MVKLMPMMVMLMSPSCWKKKAFPYRLIDLRTYGIDFYGDVLFTSQSELNTHPARVAAFRKASMDGWSYAMKHQRIIDLIMQNMHHRKSFEHLRFEAKAMWNLMQPDIIENWSYERGVGYVYLGVTDIKAC